MGLTERVKGEIRSFVKDQANEFLTARLVELGFVSPAQDFRHDVCGYDQRHRCRYEGNRGDIGIIACESGRPFAEKVIEGLEHQFKKSGSRSSNTFRLIPSEERHFANSEIKPIISESLRGMDVYVIQDVENKITGYSVDENLRALLTTMDAAHRSDAHYVTAVVPAFPYARQDRAMGRESFTAAMVARELEDANAERVITLDIHNAAIGGFFRRALLEDLHASKNFLDYIHEEGLTKNLVVCAPDTGAAGRNKHYAERIGTELAMIYKTRDYKDGGEVDGMRLLGSVKGKNVLVVDDMIDTAGTSVKAAKLLKDHEALEVYLVASLALFNGPALDRLDKAYDQGIINRVIISDAVYHGGDEFLEAHPCIHRVSVAGYKAKVIFNINHHRSISELLK
ncbi:MAG: ribose-phosphate pyrophosphokinase [archaeon]